MRTFPFLSIIIISAIFLLIDLYAFRGLKKLTSRIDNRSVARVIHILYWSYTTCFLIAMLWISYNFRARYTPGLHVQASYLFGLGLASGIPKIVFILFHGLEDVISLLNKISRKLFRTEPVDLPGQPITRSAFLTRAGLAAAAIPFVSISYGILKGRFDFRVISKKLYFSNLPEAFDGMRIVQVSDIHIGSFDKNYDAVSVGIDLINAQKGDLLFFTGDLVNNYAEEMEGWVPVLGRMEAGEGKYSILGNHDYGDYSNWQTEDARQTNFNRIKAMNGNIGFDLITNGNRILERDGQQVALIGVENWGKPPFHQYGDLEMARSGTEGQPFKILLSHDPSHWDAEVLGQTDIDLTLSGHTHGAQFGVEIAGVKWSPVQIKYPRWAGLYREGNQYLYVNRGFGYIGFPGRIGMAPEITVLELYKA